MVCRWAVRRHGKYLLAWRGQLRESGFSRRASQGTLAKVPSELIGSTSTGPGAACDSAGRPSQTPSSLRPNRRTAGGSAHCPSRAAGDLSVASQAGRCVPRRIVSGRADWTLGCGDYGSIHPAPINLRTHSQPQDRASRQGVSHGADIPGTAALFGGPGIAGPSGNGARRQPLPRPGEDQSGNPVRPHHRESRGGAVAEAVPEPSGQPHFGVSGPLPDPHGDRERQSDSHAACDRRRERLRRLPPYLLLGGENPRTWPFCQGMPTIRHCSSDPVIHTTTSLSHAPPSVA